MRKLIISFAMLASLVASAQTDTLTIVRPNTVTIITTTDNVSVEVTDNNGNIISSDSIQAALLENRSDEISEDSSLAPNTDKKVHFKSNDRFSLHHGRQINNGQNSTPDFSSSGWEIWMNDIINFSLESKHLGANIGMGCLWRHYWAPSDQTFTLENDIVGCVAKDANQKKSKLLVYSTTFGLDLHYNFAKKISLGVGPVLNINHGLSIKNRYEEGNVMTRLKVSDPKPRKITIDYMAYFRYKAVGIYYKYAPQSLFKAADGPEFNTHTIGLSLHL